MSKKDFIEINLDINDDVFTNKTGAELVIAIMEYLLYQRQQIPFVFSTFKFLLSNIKEKIENDEKCDDYKKCFVQQQHENALATFDAINNIKNNLYEEFKKHKVSTIRILFGATSLTPREAYVIKLPQTLNNNNHSSSLRNHNNYCHDTLIKNVLMTILTSQSLYEVFSTNMSPTNTFIDIEMETDYHYESTKFYQKEYSDLPKKCTKIFININHNKTGTKTDDHFNILNDIENMKINENSNKISNTSTKLWWEAKDVIKGFKETLIKGQSIW